MSLEPPPNFLPLDDPEIAAAVESAIEPYKAIYTPAMIERARRDLRALLASHPYTVALAKASRPRAEKAESTNEKIEGATSPSRGRDEEPARSSGKGGGRGGAR